MTKNLIILLLLGLAGWLLYNQLRPKPTPMERLLNITYVPATFNESIDEKKALTTLSNPSRYRKEFDQLVYDFNLTMLQHVANRMGLRGEQREMLVPEYRKHHTYLSNLYYEDMMKLNDTSDDDLEDKWYSSSNANAVEVMNEVGSKYACFMVNHVIKAVLESSGGSAEVSKEFLETPCAIVMTEALKPMIDRLRERAGVQDLRDAEEMFENKIEKVIAELAVREIRDKKGINKKLQTKIWGYAVSETDLEISAISVLKLGYKLDKYFKMDIDETRKRIVVHLPEPEILSHEVYPKVEKLDIGWMRGIDKKDFNKNFNVLRAEFRREVLEAGELEKTKGQAEEIMNLFIQPLIKSLDNKYKLKVKFQYSDDPDISEGPAKEVELNIPDSN